MDSDYKNLLTRFTRHRAFLAQKEEELTEIRTRRDHDLQQGRDRLFTICSTAFQPFVALCQVMKYLERKRSLHAPSTTPYDDIMSSRDMDNVTNIWQATSDRLQRIERAFGTLGEQHRAMMVKVNRLYNDDILFAKQQLENLGSEINTQTDQRLDIAQKLNLELAVRKFHLGTLEREIREETFNLEFQQEVYEEKMVGITDIRGRIKKYGWDLFPIYGLDNDLARAGYQYYLKWKMPYAQQRIDSLKKDHELHNHKLKTTSLSHEWLYILVEELDLLTDVTTAWTDRCTKMCLEMRRMQEQMTTDQGCTRMNFLAANRVSSLSGMLGATVSVEQVLDAICERVELFIQGAKEVLGRSPLTEKQKRKIRHLVLVLEYELGKEN